MGDHLTEIYATGRHQLDGELEVVPSVHDTVARRENEGLLLQQWRKPVEGDGGMEASKYHDSALYTGHIYGLP